jgi:hypothetical protein
MSVFQRLPLLVGSTGRGMAFFGMTTAELKRQFASIRWDRPLSFVRFTQQVKKAKRCGYGIDEGYYAFGTVSISVPNLQRERNPRYDLQRDDVPQSVRPATGRRDRRRPWPVRAGDDGNPLSLRRRCSVLAAARAPTRASAPGC